MIIMIVSSRGQDEFSEYAGVGRLLEDNNTCNEMNDSPPLPVSRTTELMF